MREYIGLDSNIDYMTEAELKEKYGLTQDFLRVYFPMPIAFKCADEKKKDLLVWKTKDVECILLDKDFQNAYEKTINITSDKETNIVRNFLKSYDLKALAKTTSDPGRRFILHVGPTNSGKTYNALQSLKHARKGVYLGPLRLLALEIFDTLNHDGYPCNLSTGQEYEDVPFAGLTASTIELCNYDEHYDIAVIDEVQCIADSVRGGYWTRALFQINAEEIHLCLAPDALKIVVDMIRIMGCKYTINRYERKTPLIFSGVFKDLTCVMPGDALIAFSRKRVLAIAAALEEMEIKTSVIYGSLPPKARRSEVEKFSNGTTQVVVATDAIGMGVSLPVKRVIFCETEKFDGKRFRHLRNHEIKQIAGRAGRFGKYPVGEVLTMSDPDGIQDALNSAYRSIEKFTMPFPVEAFAYSDNIALVLSEWERLFPCKMYRRKSMENELALYKRLKKAIPCEANNSTVFKLISSPFDNRDYSLSGYWLDCCRSVLTAQKPDSSSMESRMSHGEEQITIPYPTFSADTLEGCELRYKALDLRHHILRKFDIKEEIFDEKDTLCDEINQYLISDKDKYLMKCRKCGKKLEFNQKIGLCDKCYQALTEEQSKLRALKRKKKQKTKSRYSYHSKRFCR